MDKETLEVRRELAVLRQKLELLRKKVKWTVEDEKTAYFLNDAIKSRELFIQIWS